MAENNIDDIRQRLLRRPPVSSRRLENVGLDLEVPLEHVTSEVLPLVSHETLGVGYGFDRLYALDLSAEQPVPIPLPSRHELTKFARGAEPMRLSYGGISGHFSARGGFDNASAMTLTTGQDRSDFLDTHTGGIGGISNINGNATIDISLRSRTDFQGFARAFIGPGHDITGGSDRDVIIGPRIAQNPDRAENQLMLDPLALQNFCDADGSYMSANRRRVINTLQYLYKKHSPSAWETVLYNKKLFTDLPKALVYLDKAFYSLYQRDRIGAFQTKIRDMELLYLVLGMTEAMYAIRRGRFSENISSQTVGNNGPLLVRRDQNNNEISKGVINPFFTLLQSSGSKMLVAPWWLINKLNHVLYLDTDRDEEVRDVERKDITEMMTLLLEAMEVERGLHWSSESNLPLILFEKYKEGQFPDFSDFTDTNASLSATLLGFDSARDAYYDRPNDYIGRVPYFSTIATRGGQLIGDAKAEFLDRIAEMEKATMMSPAPEKFKQGMQYANAFDYSTMVTRTRFGDHSMECKIYPFGFYRGVLRPSASITEDDNPLDASAGEGEINLVFFPVYNWSQFSSRCTTFGLLPNGMNGAAYATGSRRSANAAWTTATSSSEQLLWPNMDGTNQNYWMPGGNNYSALLLASTDELFQSWVDRGEQVRAEGATFPAISPINLMAEMTYTTPMAMFQRNWPWLRKMSTYASHSPVPKDTDESFDYMTLGDNVFNMSVHATGPRDLAEDASGTSDVRQGPLMLRDRQLFSTAAHLRSAGTELAPMVLPLSKTPDNWVGVFQARDAMYFLTSLLAEPIMDAYTWNTNSATFAVGPSNGIGSARLVVYQGSKTFEGRVEDVYCTPIVGVGQWYDSSGAIQESTLDPNYRTGLTRNDANAIYNSIFRGNSSSYLRANNYLIFRLGNAAIESGNVLLTRDNTGHTAHVARSPSVLDNGDFRYIENVDATVLTEDDFVPGLYWDKLWLPRRPVRGTTLIPWNMLFAHPYSSDGTGLPVTGGDSTGLVYLQGTTPTAGVPVPIGTTTSTTDPTEFDTNPGYELGADDHLIDNWRMIHVNWIEQSRVNLEYQRAAPSFYVFDLDITDRNESYLRQSLFPLGLSTVGPLTFVGGIGPEGQQVAAETVTGPTVFELNALTLGAGTIDESPSEANDMDVGEENPSLHIAEKQDV